MRDRRRHHELTGRDVLAITATIATLAAALAAQAVPSAWDRFAKRSVETIEILRSSAEATRMLDGARS